MRLDKTLGVIGGGGWLGRAIIGCLLRSELLPVERMVLSSRQPRPGLWPEATWTSDNQMLTDRSDVIVVSVRPGDFAALHVSAKGRLVISVMAGVSVRDVQARLASDRVIRALPNAAAEVGRSYTPWFASPECSAADREAASLIFNACGPADQVQDEGHIDYFAAVTGTGPAYPALLADVLRRDAIAHGISPEIARRAMTALLIGTGRVFEAQGRCPSEVVEDYVNYRGMTTSAIEAMRAASFEPAILAGVAAALRKAMQMQSKA